jgi:hypothetical protein
MAANVLSYEIELFFLIPTSKGLTRGDPDEIPKGFGISRLLARDQVGIDPERLRDQVGISNRYDGAQTHIHSACAELLFRFVLSTHLAVTVLRHPRRQCQRLYRRSMWKTRR